MFGRGDIANKDVAHNIWVRHDEGCLDCRSGESAMCHLQNRDECDIVGKLVRDLCANQNVLNATLC